MYAGVGPWAFENCICPLYLLNSSELEVLVVCSASADCGASDDFYSCLRGRTQVLLIDKS